MGFARLSAIIAAAAALALLGNIPGRAEGGVSRRADLKRVRVQLESVRRQMKAYQDEEETLSGRIDALQKEREAAAKRLKGLKRQLGQTGRRRQDLERNMAALNRSGKSWRDLLRSETESYAESIASGLSDFSVNGLWEEALRRAAIIQKIEWLQEIEGAHRTALGRVVRVQVLSRALLSQKQTLESQELRRESETAEIARGKQLAHERAEEARRKAEELARTEKKLEELLAAYAARERRLSAAAPLPHSLAWPCAGRVLETFGKTFDAKWRAAVFHEGILLETAARAPVRAVLPGRVIFTGPFHSYGLVVILEHRSGYFSIYGRLGSVLKQKGAEVAVGDAIAVSGQRQGGKGVIYFELRRAAQALDPLVWLAPSWRGEQ